MAIGGEFGELSFPCSQCHGFDGQGDPSGAFPRLADQSAFYLFNSLRNFATGRRPSEVMGPIAAELTLEQMRDVAAYFASRKDVPYPPGFEAEEQLIRQGNEIVMGETGDASLPACTTCHGPGVIGDAPLYPYLAGQLQPYVEHQLNLFKRGVRGGDFLGVMHEIAAKLTDQQIQAVAAYVATLRPEMTTPGDDPDAETRSDVPERLPMMTGAVISPKPGLGDVVIPHAETAPEAH